MRRIDFPAYCRSLIYNMVMIAGALVLFGLVFLDSDTFSRADRYGNVIVLALMAGVAIEIQHAYARRRDRRRDG